MKPKAVIFDLDRTIRDDTHRQPYLVAQDWDNYCGKAQLLDTPNEWAIAMARDLNEHVIVLTRSHGEDYIRQWLDEHYFYYDALYCATKSETRDVVTFKREVYKEKIEPKYDVILVIDDMLSLCHMFKYELGLNVLRVFE